MDIESSAKVVDTFGVKNQYVIDTPDGVIFQSYDSIIAFIPDGQDTRAYLDKNRWDYSKTTLRYLKLFLEVDSINDIRDRIRTGIYTFANLN